MAPLQPIQQTVFEQGPQSAPVPTAAPAFVFQEEQVIRPEPINPVQATDPGIAWNALGAEAMGIASNLYEKTLDFLIRTKTNKVADLQDKYQNQLNDLYQQQTLELYNADKQKRLTNEQLMKNLQTGITNAKNSFKKDAIDALGDDAFFQDTLDLSKWGLKYQELAVFTRRAERDINAQASKLLYDSQRVANGVAREEETYGYWKDSDVGTRDPKLIAKVYNGVAPIPTTADGLPLIGMTKDSEGKPIPKTMRVGETDIPVVVQKDGFWFLNPPAIEVLDVEEQLALYEADQKTQGSTSAVLNVAGKPTKETEDLLKEVAKNPTGNIGVTLRAAVVLSQVPDTMSANLIDSLDGVNSGEKAVLSLMRLHIKNGGKKEELGRIRGLSRSAMEKNTGAVSLLASDTSLFVTDPDLQAKLKLASQVTAKIARRYGMDVSEEDITLESRGQRLMDTEGLSASALLKANPALKSSLLQVLTLMDENPTYNLDNPEVMEQLLAETINREGYVIIPNEAGQVPIVAFNRQLSYVNGVLEGLRDPESKDKTFDEFPYLKELRETAATDPMAVSRFMSTAQRHSTSWAKNLTGEAARDLALSFAKTLSPTLDEETFLAIYDSSASEEISNGARVQGVIPMGELIRIAISATPTAMQNSGKVVMLDKGWAKDTTLAKKIEAAKVVYDDLPLTEQDGLIEFGHTVTPHDLSFIGSPNGGIPIHFKKLVGKTVDKDGKTTDYLRLLTQSGSYSQTYGGTLTPRLADTTPLMFIPAERDANARREMTRNLTNEFKVKEGKPVSRRVGYSKAPNATVPSPNEVIAATDSPVFLPGMEEFVGMDAPLNNWEDARTFFVINNDGLFRLLSEYDTLKDVKFLLHELAVDPETRIPTDDKNKTLFSEANLQKLFESAKKSGAQTQGDFLGYVVRAMQVYQENSQQGLGRERTLEKNSESTPEDFLGRGGTDKGVILYSPKSDEFYAGVNEKLNQNFSLYQKGDKYYMFTPDQLPTDPKEKTKYRLVIDAANTEDTRRAQFAAFAKKRENAKLAESIMFAEAPTFSVAPQMFDEANFKLDRYTQEKLQKEIKQKAADKYAAQMKALEERSAKANAEFDAAVKANPYGKSGERMKQVLRTFESPAARARREYEERKNKSK
jgi:hypothetical protein